MTGLRICAHTGGKRTRGLQRSQDWVSTLAYGDKKQCVFAFVSANGIITSVKMDISQYISLIDIGDMWNLSLLIVRKKYYI